MPTQVSPVPTARAPETLLARAIETDRAYFEMGARIDSLHGAELAWIPELSAVPAGAVIQRADPVVIEALGGRWVSEIEDRLTEIGAGFARIYPDAPVNEEIFRRAGYQDRDELIFASGMLPNAPPGLTLRPVATEQDWHDKLLFHEAARTTPDGHANAPADWVALERRKCAHGMEAFLVEADMQAVGAIGAIWQGGLLRVKNVVVHPAHRRRSVARTMLSLMAELGRARGVSELCVVAVKGEAGELLYRATGMQEIGKQVEWSKRIGDLTE